MYLKSTVYLLILLNFILIVSSNDDGQWTKDDLPKEEAMEDDEPPVFSIPKSSDRTKKSLDLNSTIISEALDDKKLDDLKNVKDSKNIKNSNDTTGRSFGNYELDELLDEKKSSKESRIMNADDEGVLESHRPKMNIQGFIPVVGLASAAIGSAAILSSQQQQQKRQRLFSTDSFLDRYTGSNSQSSSMPNFATQNQFNPNQQINQPPRFASQQPPRYSDRRSFGSSLQNFASSLSGSLTGGVNKLAKRRQQDKIDYSSFASECICVPFYMCRSGFIEQTAKNQAGVGQTFQMAQYNQYRDQSSFNQQLQDAQAELTKYYTPQQISELLAGLNQQERSQSSAQNSGSSSSNSQNSNEQYQESQRNYATINSNSNSNPDSDLELPINERSIDGKQTHFLDSANSVSVFSNFKKFKI